MAAITIENIRKTYPGGVEAVKAIDLDISDGEFVVLVGPSGCGKSTLLRMIAGLEAITGGSIFIGDRRVNDIEPAERDIAMVFQNYALYPHMSVGQNLAYGLKNRGTPKSEIARRVGNAAKSLEIANLLHRKPRELSGGQRQRVAMGRALVREPAAFLFDEPLSNLDAKLRVQMRGEIKQLQKRLGTTSVYVTHDQLEAMTLADRLVVLNHGRIEQIGTPLEVFRHPDSTFVAGFIGAPAMNLLEGEITGGMLEIAGGRFVLPASAPQDGPVTAGIRAEAFATVSDPDQAAIALTVSYVEELGTQRLVHGRARDQKIVVSLGADGDVPGVMRLAPHSGALHLFDAQTGRALIGS